MAGSYLGRFPYPQVDINSALDALVTDIAMSVDREVTELYGSLHTIKRMGKSFSFGFIPPDIRVDFVSTEQIRRSLGVVPGNPNAGVNSKSKNTKQTKSSPNELKPKETVITNLEYGAALYRSLRSRNYTHEEANKMVPLMVGHMEAEVGPPLGKNDKNRPGSSYKTNNYNVGNVSTGERGTFKNPLRSSNNTKNNWSKSPTHPSGGKYIISTQKIQGVEYPVYKVASTSLEDAADRQSSINSQWKGTETATNGEEYAAALRPDNHGVPVGGNSQPYFTEEQEFEYARKIDVGADRFKSDLAASGKSIGDILPPEQEKDGVLYTGVRIMGSAEVTNVEASDPLSSTGRNLRQIQDERQRAAQVQVQYIQRQINAVSSTPPLLWLIPPSEFNRSYEQNIDSPKGRRGHIVHTWLQQPLIISAKGKTAAQYIFNVQGYGGITAENRIHSLSYRNLMSLVRMYKNNGYIYSGEGVFGESNDGIPLYAMSLWLYHDGRIYIGSFSDFSISDSASSPYNIDYSFKFDVRYEVDVADASFSGGGDST